MIPRVIYQTDSRSVLPEELRLNQEELLRLNPGWSLERFNEAQRLTFILAEYGAEMCAVYESIDRAYGACRADLFRYLLIYKRGGVYLDVKSSASVPFDTLLSSGQSIVLSTWDQTDQQTRGWGCHPELAAAGTVEFQQWHLIAVKGHPCLRDAIQRVTWGIRKYIPEVHGVGRSGVYRLTGPIAYSLAVAKHVRSMQVPTNKSLGLIYSIYPTSTVHRELANAHYSTLTSPIIRPDWKKKILGYVFRSAQSLKQLARIVRLLRHLGREKGK